MQAGQMYAALLNLGLPVTGVNVGSPFVDSLHTVYLSSDSVNICVAWSSAPTAAQNTAAQNEVAGFNTRGPRTLVAIYNDLAALTSAQKTNVWNDLAAGSPPKYLLDPGASLDSITVYDYIIRFSGLGAVAIADAKLRLTAIYVRDNPLYLHKPAFDPSINVVG